VECGLQIVRDGSKAVEFIGRVENDEKPRPDLILLDLNLPRMSGEEVLKRIRSSSTFQSVKVLIITSSNATGDRERAMALGATDYFRKPSTLAQFLELGPKIRQMLEAED
jgi:CheY-like chemotaxis protein